MLIIAILVAIVVAIGWYDPGPDDYFCWALVVFSWIGWNVAKIKNIAEFLELNSWVRSVEIDVEKKKDEEQPPSREHPELN